MATTYEELKKKYIKSNGYQLFIDGRFEDAADGGAFDVKCPANGEYLATCALATEKEVDKAVAAAWTAFPKWKAVDLKERSRLFFEIADLIMQNEEQLAWAETLESGRHHPSTLLMGPARTADFFRYYGSVVRAEEGISNTVNPNYMNMVIDEPVGVVGQISAWNAPLLMAGMKIPPALAAGCTIVYRPSSNTPLGTLLLGELLAKVLPPGVVNIVTGSSRSVGQYILDHPGIRKISFTGSADTGRTVAMAAAKKLAPSTLELGGKSANIYFKDLYDMNEAVEGMVRGTLYVAGQQCGAGSRIFVHEDIYDQFVERAVAAYNRFKVGPPWWDDIQMGAQAAESQVKNILYYIESAKQEGATIACGGYRLTDGELGKGCFMKPTLLIDCNNNMKAAREEIFGPVGCVIKFKTEEEVIAMANDNALGLGGGVWSKDINRALRVARGVDTGTMWVNEYLNCQPPYPWSGHKDSGWGSEMSRNTIKQFCKPKSIIINMSYK